MARRRTVARGHGGRTPLMASSHAWKAALGLSALLAGSVVAAAAPAAAPGASRLVVPAAGDGRLSGVLDARGATGQVGQGFVATSCCSSSLREQATDGDSARQVGSAVLVHARPPTVHGDAGGATRRPPDGAPMDVVATVPDRQPSPPHGPEPGEPQAPISGDPSAQAGPGAHPADHAHAGSAPHSAAAGHPSATRHGRSSHARASHPDKSGRPRPPRAGREPSLPRAAVRPARQARVHHPKAHRQAAAGGS